MGDIDYPVDSLSYTFFNFHFLEISTFFEQTFDRKIDLTVYTNELDEDLRFSDIRLNAGSFKMDEIFNKIENGDLRYMKKEEFEEILKMNLAQMNSLLV